MINKDIAFLVTDNLLRLSKNGKSVMKSKEDPNYEKFVEMIKDPDTEYDMKDFMFENGFITENERFSVSGNDVYIDGELVSGSLPKHLHYCWTNSLPVDPIIAFWDNLKQMPTGFHDASGIWRDNPFYKETKDSLFAFLQVHGYPITNDGHFLAEKTVRSDLGSIHDNGKTKHVLGEVTEMPRYAVNHNNSIACSFGLHVRSNRYNFGSSNSVVIIVKVNPKDVVSIPKDYITTDRDGNVAADKMRVCAYRTMDVKGDEDLVQQFFENQQRVEKELTYVDVLKDNMEQLHVAWGYLKDHLTTLEEFNYALFQIVEHSKYSTDEIIDEFLNDYDHNTSFSDYENLMREIGVQ